MVYRFGLSTKATPHLVCKHFLSPAGGLSVLTVGIFTHSSLQNSSTSEICLGHVACTACWRSSHSFSMIEEIHTLQFAFLEEGHGCTFWIFVFFAEIYWNPFFHLHSQCFLCYATPNHKRSTLVLNNACDLFPKCLWHIIMLFCVLQTFTFAARSQVRFLMTLLCRSCLSKLFHAFLPRIRAALSKRCRLLTDLTLTSF